MIYVLFADGLEEIEAITPIDILRRGGCEVRTVGISGKNVIGAHRIPLSADLTLEEVSVSDMEMLILPGGPGHVHIPESTEALSLIQAAAEKKCYLAAICAAPSILGKMGLLKGKKATCFPGFEDALSGAFLTDEKVCTDGNLITAKGAGAAAEFGFSLLSLLKGEACAEKLKGDMQY